MEFTVKDFEAVGDTIERQKKLILAFERWLGATIMICPLAQSELAAGRTILSKEENKILDNYIEQRRKELSQKKSLDK